VLLLVIAAAVLVLLSMSWTHLRGAPWYPTPVRKVEKMLSLVNLQAGEKLYDLGCGDGRILVIAARRFGARAVGVELDPLRYLWCQGLVTVLGLRKRVQVIQGDFFSQDLSQADVVACYLLQSTNDRLETKLKQELHAGARVVSHAFIFSSLREVSRDENMDVYVYAVDGDSSPASVLRK